MILKADSFKDEYKDKASRKNILVMGFSFTEKCLFCDSRKKK